MNQERITYFLNLVDEYGEGLIILEPEAQANPEEWVGWQTALASYSVIDLERTGKRAKAGDNCIYFARREFFELSAAPDLGLFPAFLSVGN
jgi:hypothetical protein